MIILLRAGYIDKNKKKESLGTRLLAIIESYNYHSDLFIKTNCMNGSVQNRNLNLTHVAETKIIIGACNV